VKSSSTRWLVAAALVAAAVAAPLPNERVALAAPNPTPPDGFVIEAVLGGHGELSNPIAVAFASDGTIFVAQKNGLIKRFSGLDDPTAQTFADLRTETFNYADKGMLGLAVDPQFETGRPYVYAAYSYDAPPGEVAPYWNDTCPDPPGASTGGCVTTAKVVRLTAVDNDPASGQITLLHDWCHQFTSHTIGHVEIGPDGSLYVSGGDGANFDLVDYGQLGVPTPNPCGDPGGATPPSAEGGALRAQDARTAGDPQGLSGAIVRIDPDTGLAEPGNPYIASADLNRRRVIAYGMRNPYRFTFRPGTEELWAADVGWANHEEINRISDINDATAENFGWPCYEGTDPQGSYFATGLTLCNNLFNEPIQAERAVDPYISYTHADPVITGETCDLSEGSAATGVAFYEDGGYPAPFDGAMFVADYTRQCVWVVYPDGAGLPDWSTRQVFLAHGRFITDMEIGPGGDLYWVNAGAGSVERVQYYAGNRPPVAHIAASPRSGTVPLSVHFDANGSADVDAGDSVASVAWDLDGDGQFDDSTSFSFDHVYNESGVVFVGLRATDQFGATDTDTVAITPAETPPATLFITPTFHDESGDNVSDELYHVGETISFSGVSIDTQDGVVPAANYRWELRQQHCVDAGGCHAHLVQEFLGVDFGSFPAPDHAYPTYLELEFFATDSAGLTGSTIVRINPETATLNVTSTPPGLRINVDSATQTTPFSRTVIVDSQHSVSALNPQELGGFIHEWASWSDGLAEDHTVTVPDADLTIDAEFEITGLAPSSFDYRITGANGRTDRFANHSHTQVGQVITSNNDIVAAASTPSRAGFWRVSAAGRVSVRGDATKRGALSPGQRHAPAVDIEGTETGNGYWILLANGSVHAYGDAVDFGQPTERQVRSAAVAIARTPTGNGYWVTDARGAVYHYGDARWRGSLTSTFHAPVADIAVAADGLGYWMLTEQGIVHAFGTAINYGSHISGQRAIAIMPTPTGSGYWLLGIQGSVWNYGDAPWFGRWTAGSTPIGFS
jgi:glucose/arabinose dehydrogenase